MRPNMIPDPQTLEELLEEMDDSDVPDLNEGKEFLHTLYLYSEGEI